MRSVRTTRLLRELRLAPGRTAAMVVAILAGTLAVGTGLGAYAILTREIARSYLETRPASATIELAAVPPDLVARVRALPEIADAEARATVLARAEANGRSHRLLLFVVPDFDGMRLSRFEPERGAWPPPPGAMLIERSSTRVLGPAVGDAPAVRTPTGRPTTVPIAGQVHDPGLAPAWMEQTAYGYVTPETLRLLGERGTLDELRVVFEGEARASAEEIDARASTLAAWLERSGHAVHELRVPPPRAHPHEGQMRAILAMLSGFGAVALLLGGVLLGSVTAARMASQAREVGILKAIGARSDQIATMALGVVAALGAGAAALGLPLAQLFSRLLASRIAEMLNFELRSDAIPAWAPLVQGAASILVPLLVSAIPAVRAARATVRSALDGGAATAPFGSRPLDRWLARTRGASAWMLAARNAFRRRAWLAVTTTELAIAGATFLMAIGVAGGWSAWADEVERTRNYDLEVVLQRPASIEEAIAAVRTVDRVRSVEAWGRAPAALPDGHGHALLRTYPDGGHGSLRALGAPADMRSVELPLLEGRWLAPGDDPDAIVLNELGARRTRARVGDRVELAIEDLTRPWRVVGIVHDVGSQGAAYLPLAAFQEATGTAGRAAMLRIDLDEASPGAPRAVEEALERAGFPVEDRIPRAMLRTAVGDHVGILVFALVVLALLMGTVGTIGLGAATATQIVERSREIGVLRSIGATPARLVAGLVAEGALVALLAAALGTAASIPLTAGIGAFLGNLSFGSRLPLVISPLAIAGWTAAVLLASAVATALPALAASRRTIPEALGHA